MIRISRASLAYMRRHWKLIVHLVLRTKRFGVNNQRRSEFDSMFGVDRKRIVMDVLTVRRIFRNLKMMKIRARLGFVGAATYKLLYGEEKADD